MQHAELSSLAGALEELTTRVTRVAGELDRPPTEDVAAELFEVERLLVAASRRLSRVVHRSG